MQSNLKLLQVSSWATAVTLFRDLSGYIYSVLQAFLIAMTPILIAAAFIPGTGWGMVKSYIQITVWLALWMPVLEIINFIVNLYAQGQFGAVFGSSMAGYSMASMAIVDKMSSHLVLAAGFLATLTPLITWSLVKGSFAFTEFLSGGLGAHLAGLAGSIAATGNISLENQSYGNASMNQHMLASTMVAGTQAAQDYAITNQGAQTHVQGGGVGYGNAMGKQSASHTSNNAKMVQQSKTAAHAYQHNASTEQRESQQQTLQSLDNLQHSLQQSEQSGHSLNNQQMATFKQTMAKLVDTAYTNKYGNSAKAEDGLKRVFDANASASGIVKGIMGLLGGGGKGGKGGGGFGLDAGARAVWNTDNDVSTTAGTETSASQSTKTGGNVDYGKQATQASNMSDALTDVSNAVNGYSDTASQGFAKAAVLSDQAQDSYTRADQAIESASNANTISNPVSPFNTPGGAVASANAAQAAYVAKPPGNVDTKFNAVSTDVDKHEGDGRAAVDAGTAQVAEDVGSRMPEVTQRASEAEGLAGGVDATQAALRQKMDEDAAQTAADNTETSGRAQDTVDTNAADNAAHAKATVLSSQGTQKEIGDSNNPLSMIHASEHGDATVPVATAVAGATAANAGGAVAQGYAAKQVLARAAVNAAVPAAEAASVPLAAAETAGYVTPSADIAAGLGERLGARMVAGAVMEAAPTIALSLGAAAVSGAGGYAVGRLIDNAVEDTTGTALSTRLADQYEGVRITNQIDDATDAQEDVADQQQRELVTPSNETIDNRGQVDTNVMGGDTGTSMGNEAPADAGARKE